jgi:hypothetical protein
VGRPAARTRSGKATTLARRSSSTGAWAFSYEVVNDGCKVKLRLIAAGTLLTYTRR